MLLKNCRYLVTQNKKREILENVDVLVQESTIRVIGKNLQKKYPDEHALDCSLRIVMPGLINAHMHLGMTSLRGYSDDKELAAWLKQIVVAEKRFGTKEIESSAYLGIVEALRTGTTTVAEMYDPLAPSIKAAEALGIRMVAYYSYFSAHGKLPVMISLPRSPSMRITLGLGPHSIYGTDEKFLLACREFGTRNKVPLTIHLSETRKERAEWKAKTGKLPVEYLESLGFLGPDVLIAHCVWLTKGELEIMKKHDVKVVHCPQSNMKLAGGGVMPLKEMQERNIIVGLGTDSTASNNSLDMFREMHVAALLHKHHYWDPAMADAQTVLDLATINGAKALSLNAGSLEEGKLADIITLDLNDVNLHPHKSDRIVSHLVYAANGMNVSEVIVDGKLLLHDKKFVR